MYDSVRNFFIRKIDYEYEDFLKYIGFPIVELRILGGGGRIGIERNILEEKSFGSKIIKNVL